ncbi:MAG TPA: biotin/lipoyl-binding protein, partial [Casimicrobiaceae bacterium]|nr:biotin/lipoyl-binding protein [Casimicrobiaceae bacterium]
MSAPGKSVASPQRGRVVTWIVVALVVAGVAAGIWYGYRPGAAGEASPAATSTNGPGAAGGFRKGGGPDAGKGPLPVATSAVGTTDFNVYLNALGNVTPRSTVTVRPRVDGQLARVLFKEGQMVKAGDVLAEIDPKPFEVQVTQANGQLARDQAQLANARIDLTRYQTLLKQDSIAQQQVDTQAALV